MVNMQGISCLDGGDIEWEREGEGEGEGEGASLCKTYTS
jgi:hypothetical protein